MINLLGFIPSKFYKKKIVKRVETVYYYLTLFVMGVIFVQYSSINPKTVRSWLIVTCIVEAVLVGKLYVDIRELLLIIGMGVYYYIAGEDVVGNVLLVVCSYEFIKLFIFKKGCDYHKRVIQMICVMALGMFVCYKIDFLNYRSIEGIRIVNWNAMWGDVILGSTVCAFYLIFLSCAVFWAIISIKQHICLSIILMIGTVIGIADQLKTATRMTVVIFIITFCFLCLIHFFKNIKNLKIVKVYIFSAILMVIVFTFVVGIYMMDYGNIKEKVPLDAIKKMVNRNGGIIHNVRFEYMMDVLFKLPNHLMGGIEMKAGDSPHNLWICLARTAGIIPFVTIVIFSIISFADCVCLLKRINNKDGAEYLITGIYIGLNLYYMIERAIESNTLFWPAGCMIAGIIRALWVRDNIEKKHKSKKKNGKNTVVLISVLVVMIPNFVSCNVVNERENLDDTNEAIEEYIDDGEYDDIALMGEGTKDDPYLINDYNDLIYFYNAVNTGWLFDGKYILQTNDIDMSEHPFWPIAEYTTPYSFLGTYDGGGHVIQNVCLYTEYYSAIFGKLGGTVMNLGIIDGYIDGWKSAGLVGICTSHDAKILNCYTVTTLNGKEVAGIAVSGSGTISGCFARNALRGRDTADTIVLEGDCFTDGCYSARSDSGRINCLYNIDRAYWFSDDMEMKLSNVVSELNSNISCISDISGMSIDSFNLWVISENGEYVCLSTEKADESLMLVNDNNNRLKDIHSAYTWLAIIYGVVISSSIIVFTARIKQ